MLQQGREQGAMEEKSYTTAETLVKVMAPSDRSTNKLRFIKMIIKHFPFPTSYYHTKSFGMIMVDYS